MATTVSVSLTDDLAARLEEELEYGDNRSALFRDALRHYLDTEGKRDTQLPDP